MGLNGSSFPFSAFQQAISVGSTTNESLRQESSSVGMLMMASIIDTDCYELSIGCYTIYKFEFIDNNGVCTFLFHRLGVGELSADVMFHLLHSTSSGSTITRVYSDLLGLSLPWGSMPIWTCSDSLSLLF